jgi:hypothetical protein
MRLTGRNGISSWLATFRMRAFFASPPAERGPAEGNLTRPQLAWLLRLPPPGHCHRSYAPLWSDRKQQLYSLLCGQLLASASTAAPNPFSDNGKEISLSSPSLNLITPGSV